jgi:hypothetical protein
MAGTSFSAIASLVEEGSKIGQYSWDFPSDPPPMNHSRVERHSNRPAFLHFLHHVTEKDWYVSSLGRGLDHEAAAQRLDMRGLNAIPYFLGRDGCADECIAISAHVQKSLHVLLSQVRPDVVAERADELRQGTVRRQKLLDVAL